MSIPFLGEIKIVSFNFAPKGWALCTGQLLPINQNQPLFSLLGTYYGGNGTTNFGLPNLQGQTPIHMASGFPIGQRAGEQSHTLTSAEMPVHNHTVVGTTTGGDAPFATGNYLGGAANSYGPLANVTSLQQATVTNAGGGQSHENMQPYLVLNFCIALSGIFPSQT